MSCQRMDRTTHLGEGLTHGQIEDLMAEARAAGDEAMVQICLDAIECDLAALRKCRAAIDAAAAMDDT